MELRMRGWVVVVAVLASGCAHRAVQAVRFDELLITGDLELDKLNDEELFATATNFYGQQDWAQAARYFGRVCDFHPGSAHRREALYNAGLSLEKLRRWEDAAMRFTELADPQKGKGDALDASFRLAEVLYHQEKFEDAAAMLRVLVARSDLSIDRRIEAKVQQGICELESGHADQAEVTLRAVVDEWSHHPEKDLIDDYFPAQAQFFLGEIFRDHYEGVKLDGNRNTDQLAQDLEYKSELLLSAQGHYLRAIRVGNGYWATACGQRIGGLYESMYEHLVNAPAPSELSAPEQDVYRSELRKKIRVLISKAITVYERTLEAAERIGAASPFVEETRKSLRHMKELLLAEARAEDAQPPADGDGPPGS